ncbi:hypothetical protein [Sphingobacterium yanglingense]|uniref:Uncharacterized protein n=1 Tax=Sphingobacterium yanglingense TaxID=1437280 RepID=A0A4R6WLX3_9SPHI|nr:hypothetical protein [Sphingobacterium yanglingense]TDQ79808.1 hypothetical protein CLV99_1258 [Sphingobacterium yanglingense]
MQRIFTVIVSLIYVLTVFGQQVDTHNIDQISEYFKEIKEATRQKTDLWNKDLYGGILLVDPKSRQLYANQPDQNNTLQLQNEIYVGKLPENINSANTALQWNGKTWAMIMLPLSKNKHDRINLLAHELFHTIQTSLGYTQFNKESNHLEEKEGRIYLRLELEALKKAILADAPRVQQKHLTNALIFRKYRNAIFPGSNDLENQLELNEGLAEYTGLMISNRDREQIKYHFTNTLDDFFKNPTFVRSFAYNTTPIYGYLLSQKNPLWHQKITADSNLTDYFIESFKVKLPKDLKSAAAKNLSAYDGELIVAEEDHRSEQIKARVAIYKSKFIEQPHFKIKFENMNTSFDPRNILPIEDKGTVYPNIRVTDNWGILDVNNGALMSPNWGNISVSVPTVIEEELIQGDGWSLQIDSNYTVVKDATSGNYILIKKEKK